MRWAVLLMFVSSPAFASVDYADGVSGREASDLVAHVMTEAGVSAPSPTVPIRSFPACSHEPSVSPLNGNWSTAEITCSEPRWTRAMRTSAEIPTFAPAPTPEPVMNDGPLVIALTRSLTVGEMVTAEDVSLIPRSRQNAMDIFTSVDQVVGRRMKASVGAEQILLTRHLEPDWLVQSGTPIALQVNIGAISVIAPGEALENGRIGDVIELKNMSSGEVVRGIVSGENTVVLRPNIP